MNYNEFRQVLDSHTQIYMLNFVDKIQVENTVNMQGTHERVSIELIDGVDKLGMRMFIYKLDAEKSAYTKIINRVAGHGSMFDGDIEIYLTLCMNTNMIKDEYAKCRLNMLVFDSEGRDITYEIGGTFYATNSDVIEPNNVFKKFIAELSKIDRSYRILW